MSQPKIKRKLCRLLQVTLSSNETRLIAYAVFIKFSNIYFRLKIRNKKLKKKVNKKVGGTDEKENKK